MVMYDSTLCSHKRHPFVKINRKLTFRSASTSTTDALNQVPALHFIFLQSYIFYFFAVDSKIRHLCLYYINIELYCHIVCLLYLRTGAWLIPLCTPFDKNNKKKL